MEEKYLPIGTVCTINNSNKKVMITSYFSIEYNNVVTMYDYKGCVYPEGLLLPSQAVSFNHEDIVSIDYMGYKDNSYEVFNNNLNRKVETTEVVSDQAVLLNFQFDENGVVIFDPTAVEEVATNEVSTDNVSNPFKLDSVPEVSNAKSDDSSIFNQIKFDENGVVIEDGTVDDNQPSGDFVFDANGYVVSDGTAVETEDTTAASEPVSDGGFKFDENGVVIEDGTAVETEDTTAALEPATDGGFKFDENGVVIEDGTAAPVSDGLQFDENGIVISE